MGTSRYPSGYYNGNVISFTIASTKHGIFSILWSATKGYTTIHNLHYSISLESPMTSYDNSMPTYQMNRPHDTPNYANGSPRPNYSYGSNPNYGYSNGQRYDPRTQPIRDVHPHYYSERNVMSFK